MEDKYDVIINNDVILQAGSPNNHPLLDVSMTTIGMVTNIRIFEIHS